MDMRDQGIAPTVDFGRSVTTSDNPAPRADARRNREAVLEAAIKLLGERPDASMQEVADASGVGRTTVYRHFPNRESLVKGLFVRVVNESLAMSWRLVEEDPPAGDLYRRMGREALEITYRYRFLRAHNEMLAEVLEEAGVGLPNDPMVDYLKRAQERGELRPDMPVEWFFSVAQAVISQAVDSAIDGDFERDRAGELAGETLVSAFVL
jgi:AcrR family transcriptional regulator